MGLQLASLSSANLHLEKAEMSNFVPSTVAVFHSGNARQRSSAVQGELGRGRRARKRGYQVQVRFAEQVSAVNTLEGVVHANPGDAIVTGLFGEFWPVARGSFADKYQALSPQAMGAAGLYLSLPVDVVAVPMHAPFEVVLADGCSRLTGHAGDWLVDYGDGSLGIVNAAIFAATYELLEPA